MKFIPELSLLLDYIQRPFHLRVYLLTMQKTPDINVWGFWKAKYRKEASMTLSIYWRGEVGKVKKSTK